LNEAELEVDSEKASYKQKLEVLQQQEELIEDEEEQEQKEEDARRAKREADELEARIAQSLLPDSEVDIFHMPVTISGRADHRVIAAARES
jgi:LETM1 and EF-hand domain-containing protein 1, mitochondrial